MTSKSKIMAHNGPSDLEIDTLDREILALLLQDARKPYSEIAKKLAVSDGTIHVRMNRLIEQGVVKGSRVLVDPKLLGLSISAFVGITLDHARDYPRVIDELQKIPEITEVYFTTGEYNILVKVYLSSINELYAFLVERLQTIEGIQATDSQIILSAPIERALNLK